MLNEFANCPRLAYLEWVQGERSESLDTLEGSFGHRRVDVPGMKPMPAGDEVHSAAAAAAASRFRG